MSKIWGDFLTIFSTDRWVKISPPKSKVDKFPIEWFEVPIDWLSIIKSTHSITPLDDSKYNFKSYYDPYQADYAPLKETIQLNMS